MTDPRRPDARSLRLRGLLANRPLVGPQTVHFDISNACNTHCTTCWHHSLLLRSDRVPTAELKRRRMTVSTFQQLLADLLELGGLEQVILSGMGEPTLNEDLYAMVAGAHAAGVAVTIITNLLAADLPRLLASRGELHVLASLGGVSEPVWQAFHAHPRGDAFRRVLAQLDFLRGVDFRPKHVQVINRQNYRELPDMVRFAAEYPAERVSFKLAALGKGTEAVALSRDEREELAGLLVPRAREEAERLGIDTDLAAFARQIHGDALRTAPIEEVGCFMGFVYCRITVELELLYCCDTAISVGRIGAGAPLAALWRGTRYQALRDRLRAGRYLPGCEQCGKLKQNLEWSERLRRNLPADAFRGLIGRA